MANAGTIPWERVRKAGSKLTTPLHPDDYLSSPSARTVIEMVLRSRFGGELTE